MRVLQVLLASMVYALLCLPTARADVITLVADAWCPFNCAANGEHPGLMVETAREVFAAAGHDVLYVEVPWSRAIKQVREGRATAVLGAVHREVPDFVFPQEPLGVVSNAFFVRAGEHWKYDGPQSLAGLRLGVVQDYDYGGELQDYIDGHANDPGHVQFALGEDPLATNIHKLLRGRIDVVVATEAVGRWAIRTLGVENWVAVAGDDGSELELFIAFSPALDESPEYARLLDEGVRRLRASGRLAEILAAYGIRDWAAP